MLMIFVTCVEHVNNWGVDDIYPRIRTSVRIGDRAAQISSPKLFESRVHQTLRSVPPLRQALVISLKRREDRWRRISARLRANPALLQYDFERLEAVDGHSALNFAQMVVDGRLRQRAFESMMSKRRRVWGQEMTPGALGCLLSHAQAWNRSAQLNETTLVLEDDVELLSPAFEHMFPQALRELPANFGLLYLGDMAKDKVTIRTTDYSLALKSISRPLWGTYAYVVSPLAARRLLLHMFPAEFQVDSYIKHVAELYDGDMPNFVVAKDLVHTDNSELRDTDAQVKGGLEHEADKAKSVRYHVLLSSSRGGNVDGDVAGGSAEHLKFDTTYSTAAQNQDRQAHVWYHTEESAMQHAVGLGLISRPFRNVLTANVDDDTRWLLCLAIALFHRGGLCFAAPFVVLRPIDHLLHNVSLGVFMSLSSSKHPVAMEERTALAPIVYVSPSLSAARCVAIIKLVLHETVTRANLLEDVRGIRSMVPEQRGIVTVFPPHIFDPLLPLRRPCHCDVFQRVHLIGCQSRCDRMVAPLYAAGYPSRMRAPRRVLPVHLHAVAPHSSEIDDTVSQRNLGLWTLMHAAPTWVIRSNSWPQFRPAVLRDPPAEMREFCNGLKAVAMHGGAYVHMGHAPRQSLLDGVLSTWRWPSTPSVDHDQGLPPGPVAIWHRTRVEGTGSAANRDFISPAKRTKQLSWRFFATPYPRHPVAVRMADACERTVDDVQQGDEGPPPRATPISSTDLIILQLQRTLADDASSVEFFDEGSVFDIAYGDQTIAHGRLY